MPRISTPVCWDLEVEDSLVIYRSYRGFISQSHLQTPTRASFHRVGAGGRLVNWGSHEGKEVGNITMPVGILPTSTTYPASSNQGNF